MGTMNELLNAAAVQRLRGQLSTVAPEVEWPALDATVTGVDGLSLRARSDLISEALLADLPRHYETVAAIFRAALRDPGFSGWLIWPVSETVTTLALESAAPDAFEDGLTLLAELTPRLTAEFAIRRFLEADLDRALAVVATWTRNPNEHVRRLASEGTRSFLPWAIRVRVLLARPEATLPILSELRSDSSDYVRRSVANHLNDLARQSPDLVTATAAEWMGDQRQDTAWVVRHGLRSLVKKGDPAALAIMGFEAATLTVSPIHLHNTPVPLPGSLSFSAEITNDSAVPVRLAVDYVVQYLKANGRLAGKVFKLTVAEVAPGATLRLQKSHAFRQMTTRVHYPGDHAIELQVNGQRYERVGFSLGM
ncbi:MAG: alkylation repair protein [Glaciihabitans sp.]|nr:alkylation repair protein [Glaciihabitans sp.]